MGARDRLRARKRPHANYRFQVEDPTSAEKALAVVQEQYRAALLKAKDGERDADVKRLAKKVEAAREKVDACFEEITLRAMAPKDLEALIAAHPPRKDHEDDDAWNTETFPRALFLECVEGVADMSAADWEAFLDENCSEGERGELLLTAQVVNVRAPGSQVPKG
ncbi:hypothetical protein [Nocardiopsis trehalosi]|uniref:hypothetical protein n=1 Tax=Nocardiopsis trehalosi TaxID=109329 RepID=UPI0008316552|nr:hypothetical protein [Nocardiopsis trehalosi]